jgi:hypothetical protein
MLKKSIHYVQFSALFFTIALLAYGFLFVPELTVKLNSDTQDVAQVFYATKGEPSFSEKNTAFEPLNQGAGQLNFRLPADVQEIRLDFSSKPFEMTIHEVAVSLFYGISWSVPQLALSPLHQIAVLTDDAQAQSFLIKSEPAANDPQISLKGDFSLEAYPQLFLFRILLSLLLASVGTVVFYYRLLIIQKMSPFFNKLEDKLNQEHFLSSISMKWLGIYTLIAIIFHLYEINNFLLSIDDELAWSRTDPYEWTSEGRWAAALFEAYIFPQPTMPFVPHLFFCFFIALSYVFLMRAYKIADGLKTSFLFPFYMAFPSLWLLNEFYTNVAFTGFGFFLVSLTVCYFIDILEKNTHPKTYQLMLLGLLLSVSIGFYQSFATLFIAMAIAYSIIRLRTKQQWIDKQEVYFCLYSVLILVFGLIFYYIFNKILKRYPDVYTDKFVNLSNPFLTLRSFFEQVYLIYSGAPVVYGVTLSILGILIVFVFCLNLKKPVVLMLYSFLLASPLLLTLLNAGIGMPVRTYIALAFVVWFVGLSALMSGKKTVIIISSVLLCGLHLQILSALGQYAAQSTLQQSADRLLAHDLYQALCETNPNLTKKDKMIIDIYGRASHHLSYPMPVGTTMGASFFLAGDTTKLKNTNRGLIYMRLMGYDNLEIASESDRRKNIADFENMPTFPAKGSVVFKEGIYLIKLGDQPNIAHQ